jgi:uncharacterized protein (TIGR03435 family)
MPAALPVAIQEQMRMSGGPGTKDPGRITYNGVTLKMLLKRAYDISPDQISGPDWLDSERYDIVAKVPPGTTPEQFRLMLQNLLAERFELRQHRETKTLPVYLLTVANNGPKLEPTETLPEYKDDEESKAASQKKASEALAAMMAARQRGELTYGRSFHLPNATVSKFHPIPCPQRRSSHQRQNPDRGHPFFHPQVDPGRPDACCDKDPADIGAQRNAN